MLRRVQHTSPSQIWSHQPPNLYLHLYLYGISSLFLKEEQEDGEKFWEIVFFFFKSANFFSWEKKNCEKKKIFEWIAKFFFFFFNYRPSGANVIKLFFFVVDDKANKLECLYLAITFQSSLTFAGNTRSLPKKEASERHSNWVGSVLALKF